ncbi:T9SS type A sorting domain-containing protein [Marivirga sp.]|uniref:T9SS type A sorting domain-containing protein n=1 Tax=Marivirga sp. TaxID=2018662 RepID=UPI002D7EFFB9|nr:T9SS type A sorting domain-containing protein [Marivirga sp.]HET8858816.1 T9SS type A sorting domain-containing protein [Marivirga sp.]
MRFLNANIVIVFLLFFSYFVEGRQIATNPNNIIRGDTLACLNSEELYVAYVFSGPEGCGLNYQWTVSGGEFSDGSRSKTGTDITFVGVIWTSHENSLRVTVASNNIADPTGSNESNCINVTSPISESGQISVSITGNSEETPPLSSWTFNDEPDNVSSVCSETEQIIVSEEKGVAPSGYLVETRLYYLDDTGEEVIIKNWDENQLDAGTFEIDYTDLHKKVTIVSESRFSSCITTTNSEDFLIDFYQIPKFEFEPVNQPECKGEEPSVKVSLTNANFSSVIIGLFKPDGDTISFQVNSDTANYFILDNSITFKEYIPRDSIFEDVKIDLIPGSYNLTMEPLILKDSAEIEYPCFVLESFNIESPPVDSISRNIDTEKIELNCPDDSVTIRFQMVREGDVSSRFDYRLYNQDSLIYEAGNLEGEFSHSVGEGEYYFIGKNSICEWDTEAVLKSDTAIVESHSFSFTEQPSSELEDGTDFHIKCRGNSTASIRTKAQDALGGLLAYRLERIEGGDSYQVIENIEEINNKEVEFINLPAGDYQVRVKYFNCVLWTADNVIVSDPIRITEPDEIELDTNDIESEPPVCRDGDDGSVSFIVTGGIPEYSIIEATINAEIIDKNHERYTFNGLTIDSLSAFDSITSVVFADSESCDKQFDIDNFTVGQPESPFQFVSENIINPLCYNSSGEFQFSIENANTPNISCDVLRIEDESIVEIPDVNDFLIDEDSNFSLTETIVFPDEEIQKGYSYKLILSDGTCTIESDTISFETQIQPTLTNLKFGENIENYNDKVYLKCFNDVTTVTLDLVDAAGDSASFSILRNGKEIDSSNFEVINGKLRIENVNAVGDSLASYKIQGLDTNDCQFQDFSFTIHQASAGLDLSDSESVELFDINDTSYHVSYANAADGKFKIIANGAVQNESDFGYEIALFENGDLTSATIKKDVDFYFFDGLKADVDYRVSISDALGCTKDTTFQLKAPAPIKLTEHTNSYNGYEIACANGSDTIFVNTSGGIYPHTVELIDIDDSSGRTLRIDSASQNIFFPEVPAGTYKFIVRDKQDQEGNIINYEREREFSAYTLTDPENEVSFGVDMTKPTCFNGHDGTLTVIPAGGVPFAETNYKILFKRRGQNGNIILQETTGQLVLEDSVGLYYVEVEDANGCVASGEFEIENISSIDLAEHSTEPPICVGDNSGSILVRAEGGRSQFNGNNGYKFILKNELGSLIEEVNEYQISNSYTFENLYAGKYEVTLIDAANCSIKEEITLEERSDSLVFNSINYQPSTCTNTNDAIIKIESSGGDGDHQLSIDDGQSWVLSEKEENSATNKFYYEFQGLAGGKPYTILLKDSSNCGIERTMDIPKTDSVTVNITTKFITCTGGSDGKITLEPSYGKDLNIFNFSYEWYKGQERILNETRHEIDSLSAGRYQVHVMYDDIQCSKKIYDVEINQANEKLLISDLKVSDYNCNDSGKILIQPKVQGGWGLNKYSFQLDQQEWKDISAEGDGDFYISEPLTAGSHVLRFKDSLGCEVSRSFEVSFSKPALNLIEKNDVSCYNDNNGEIFVQGEYLDMKYTLFGIADTLDMNAKNGTIFSGLTSGQYQIVAEKDSCISDTLIININNPSPLVIEPFIVQNASCGKSNGILSVDITGGVEPYDTIWKNSNNQIVSFNGLESGQYSVEITDKNGCTADRDIFLSEVTDIEIELFSHSPTSCGLDNGKASIKVENAVEPFEIYWNNTVYNSTEGLSRDSLAAGNYSIKVIDALGCRQDTVINIQPSEGINVSLENATYTDCGIDNGFVELSIEGATSGYIIDWPENINPIDKNSATGFLGGIFYEVTVRDSLGCSTDYEFKVPTTSDLEINPTIKLPSCGNSNGSIEIDILGGISPYKIEWETDSLMGSKLENLAAGQYSVTVEDSVGCIESKQITLYDDETVFPDYELEISNPSCLNDDGSIELNLLNNPFDFTSSWLDFPFNASVRSNLSSGTYTAILRNEEGCYKEIPIELNSAPRPSLNETELINPLCGKDNGTIKVTATDNIQKYYWSHNEDLNQSIANNLAPENYWVVGENFQGCLTDTLKFTLENINTNLSARIISDKPASCVNAPDGSISVEGLNGNPPYQFKWDDPNNQKTSTATGLFPGDYSVLITDSSSCTHRLDYSLGVRPPLAILNFESVPPKCANSEDGQITVNVRGGSGNYEYEWSNGETSKTISGLRSGIYNVKVLDGDYCSIESEFTLNAPKPLSVIQNVQPPVCIGEKTGYANLSFSGGVGNYSVEWPDGITNLTRNDLEKGIYNVLVSDANNCSSIFEIVIPAKDEIIYNYEVIPPKCLGDQNALISLNIISGVDNPLIQWSNGQIGSVLRNIEAGDYIFSILDNNNCSFTDTISVYDPHPLEVTSKILSEPTCNGSRNGSISVNIEGGNSPYKFKWEDGNSTKNRSNLGAGIYNLEITDQNNCSLFQQFLLGEPEPIRIKEDSVKNVTCFNANDGFIFLEATGGTGNYTYNWSDGYQGNERTNLSPGLYSVSISDENNCAANFDYRITQPDPISINFETYEPICDGANDGRIEISVQGGNAPYLIEWGTGETGSILDNISAGTFNVQISDSKGCKYSRDITLNQPYGIIVTNLEKKDPLCYQEASGYAKILASGGNGNVQVEWEDGLIATERNDLLAGMHKVILRDENNCFREFEFSLNEPSNITVDNIPSEVFLCGGSSLILDPGAWKTYNWKSDNGFSSDEREVEISAEGNYTLEVSTEFGCTDVVNFEIVKDENLLSADFLLTSEAVVGDTVVIVDISWPIPDSIRWDNLDNPDVYVVNQNDFYQEIIFTEEGDFELGMHAFTGLCQDYTRKAVEVISREVAEEKQAQRSIVDKDIDFDINIYPNPNFGKFRLNVEANQLTDVEVTIYDSNKGIFINDFKARKAKNFAFEIKDGSLKPGVYLVVVKSGKLVKTEKFIVR